MSLQPEILARRVETLVNRLRRFELVFVTDDEVAGTRTQSAPVPTDPRAQVVIFHTRYLSPQHTAEDIAAAKIKPPAHADPSAEIVGEDGPAGPPR
jgi:hypothetical protein